jgi:NAD(P)H-nitrite reductase large subunit
METSDLSCKSTAVKRTLHECCSYSETDIITVLKSVARTRLVKTENTAVCITVNCKVCRPAIALYYLLGV